MEQSFCQEKVTCMRKSRNCNWKLTGAGARNCLVFQRERTPQRGNSRSLSLPQWYIEVTSRLYLLDVLQQQWWKRWCIGSRTQHLKSRVNTDVRADRMQTCWDLCSVVRANPFPPVPFPCTTPAADSHMKGCMWPSLTACPREIPEAMEIKLWRLGLEEREDLNRV